MSGETPTYKCLLCGVDHPIICGRVEHTVFTPSQGMSAKRLEEFQHMHQEGLRFTDAEVGEMLRELERVRHSNARLALENVTIAARLHLAQGGALETSAEVVYAPIARCPRKKSDVTP